MSWIVAGLQEALSSQICSPGPHAGHERAQAEQQQQCEADAQQAL